MKYNWSIPQGRHHMDFYNWFFHRFFEEPTHLRSNKIWFYSVLLQITWDYRIHGLMSVNDGAECWNKPCFLFAKNQVFASKPKTQCINQKKLGFFHPWYSRVMEPTHMTELCYGEFSKFIVFHMVIPNENNGQKEPAASLQMNRLLFENNRMRSRTSGKLPIILEGFREYTPIY